MNRREEISMSLNNEPTPEESVTDEMIAKRAYELSQSEEGGTPEENWAQAERELRAQIGEPAGE
jgi:hypothetical protein